MSGSMRYEVPLDLLDYHPVGIPYYVFKPGHYALCTPIVRLLAQWDPYTPLPRKIVVSVRSSRAPRHRKCSLGVCGGRVGRLPFQEMSAGASLWVWDRGLVNTTVYVGVRAHYQAPREAQ